MTDAPRPVRPFRLSVLDQSPIAEGSTGAQALQNSLDLARHAEALGYHRYWVAEHHGAPMLAGTTPEVLVAAIASVTSRMRVGSGGVMLPHYSPLKVAETFSVLSGLFPGRVDLAVGRASGTDAFTSHVLQRDRRQRVPDDFPEQLAELLAYLEDSFPDGHELTRLARLPGLPARPTPWMLGSSPQSGIWAAQAGLPYAFADFISPAGAPITTRYRVEFARTARTAAPEVIVAASVLCADSEQEAERLAASARAAFVKLHQGVLAPIPPPERAQAFLADNHDGARALATRRRLITGSAAQVRTGLEALAREYEADEVMVVTITYDHEVRRRSYELVAQAFA